MTRHQTCNNSAVTLLSANITTGYQVHMKDYVYIYIYADVRNSRYTCVLLLAATSTHFKAHRCSLGTSESLAHSRPKAPLPDIARRAGSSVTACRNRMKPFWGAERRQEPSAILEIVSLFRPLALMSYNSGLDYRNEVPWTFIWMHMLRQIIYSILILYNTNIYIYIYIYTYIYV